MRNKGTIIGVAATAVVLAAAVVAGSHIGGLVAHKESERVKPPPSTQPVSSPPQPIHQPPTTPSPTGSVRPSGPANMSTGRPLLNLNRDTVYTLLDVPASSGCPARTVRINGNHNGTSDGVGFFFIDEPLTSYGDLTGDGHEEAVLGMGCVVGQSEKWKGFLLVLTATSSTSYKTHTAMPLPAKMHTLTVKRQRIRLSNAYLEKDATIIREYKLSGSRLVEVS